MNSQVHRQHPGWKRRAAVQAILGHNAAKGACSTPSGSSEGKEGQRHLPAAQPGRGSEPIAGRSTGSLGEVQATNKDGVCGHCSERPLRSIWDLKLPVLSSTPWFEYAAHVALRQSRKTSMIRASSTSVSSRFPFRGVATETATLCPPSAGRSDVAKASDRAGAGQPSINDVRD